MRLDPRDLAAAYATALASIAAVLVILCLAIYAIYAVNSTLPPDSSVPEQQPDVHSQSPT